MRGLTKDQIRELADAEYHCVPCSGDCREDSVPLVDDPKVVISLEKRGLMSFYFCPAGVDHVNITAEGKMMLALMRALESSQ